MGKFIVVLTKRNLDEVLYSKVHRYSTGEAVLFPTFEKAQEFGNWQIEKAERLVSNVVSFEIVKV